MSSTVPSLGNVCLIGGCGFLGHHIVKLLHSRHPQTKISVIDLRTTGNRIESKSITYHDGDITDLERMRSLFEELKPDVVIHTASPLAHLPKDLLYKVNVEGTKSLLKAAKGTGVKAFVFTSSASVVCSKEYDVVNANETWPVVAGEKQPDYYSTTKAYAEIAVLEANRHDSDLLTIALRPAGIFGEGDRQATYNMVKAYFEGKTNVQIGENDNLFDWTYVENVAHAHLLAAQALLATHKMMPQLPLDHERVDGEAFFITNDSPCYFWDFSRGVWRECGELKPLNKLWVLSKGLMMGIATITETLGFLGFKGLSHLTTHVVNYTTMTKYHSIDKAKKRLGYFPVVSLQEGIRRAVKDTIEVGGYRNTKS